MGGGGSGGNNCNGSDRLGGEGWARLGWAGLVVIRHKVLLVFHYSYVFSSIMKNKTSNFYPKSFSETTRYRPRTEQIHFISP